MSPVALAECLGRFIAQAVHFSCCVVAAVSFFFFLTDANGDMVFNCGRGEKCVQHHQIFWLARSYLSL